MEDSFITRVDKIFGSLGPSSTSSLPSLWSLSDAEVEKKEWNRERDNLDREDIPCSSSFDGFFSNEQRIPNKKKTKSLEFEGDLEDLDDDDDDDDNEEKGDKEDWDIRSSIGLDCTLDNEEEEDEFDKVALGQENDGERTFMKDVTDHGRYLNSHNVLPNSFTEPTRDRRDRLADHLSVRERLNEDKEAAGSFDSLPADDSLPVVVDSQVKVSEDGGNVKPILKRKENKSDLKLAKRVKFDLGHEHNHDQEFQTQNSVTVSYSTETAKVTEDTSSVPQYTSQVPDYIRNPSKYTRYEFDSSSELNEESNRNAFMDFHNMIRRPETLESQMEGTADLPKSITFTPKKKKTSDTKSDSEMKQNEEDASNDEPTRRVGIPVGIAAEENLENEACAMDEDEQETTIAEISGSSRKPGRQYRSKISYDDSVS